MTREKIIQSFARVRHRGPKCFRLSADPQESKLGQRTSCKRFPTDPHISYSMIQVVFPNGGYERIDIQEILHGKSARSALTCSLVIFPDPQSKLCFPFRRISLALA